MSAVTIDGVALDRVIKKLSFDISALQRDVAESAGLEFSDELIQGVVDTVLGTLDKQNRYIPVETFEVSIAGSCCCCCCCCLLLLLLLLLLCVLWVPVPPLLLCVFTYPTAHIIAAASTH